MRLSWIRSGTVIILKRSIPVVCICAALAGLLEYGLGRYFFSRTYSYYSTTEVYWEAQHTPLLYLPDPNTMWRLRPNLHLSVQEWIRPYGPEPAAPKRYEWTITTEANGFRTSSFSRLPSDVFRVLCIGDSRTLGEGLTEDQTYPSQLQRLLGDGFEVINLGADGWSMFQGRILVEREGLDLQPDAIVACFGINDTDRAWGESDYGRARRMDTIYTRIQKLLYRSMIFYAGTRVYLRSRAAIFGYTPIVAGYGEGPPRLTPVQYGSEIDRLRDLCRVRGITAMNVILPVNRYYPWPEHTDHSPEPFGDYNDVARRQEDSSDSRTIDLTRSGLSESPDRYFIDDMHLSAEGAALVARHLSGVIRQLESADGR